MIFYSNHYEINSWLLHTLRKQFSSSLEEWDKWALLVQLWISNIFLLMEKFEFISFYFILSLKNEYYKSQMNWDARNLYLKNKMKKFESLISLLFNFIPVYSKHVAWILVQNKPVQIPCLAKTSMTWKETCHVKSFWRDCFSCERADALFDHAYHVFEDSSLYVSPSCYLLE